MKILTKEEEAAHYNETLKGGSLGGILGLGIGTLGVYGAAVRYPAFRQLTLPLRAFLVTSSSTFGAIVTADHFSRSFEASRHPDEGYQNMTERARALEQSQKSSTQQLLDYGKEHRYQIVGGSWIASMALSLSLVGRNPYLSTAQKLVQARVYAQSLTIAVLIVTAVFEISDRNKEEGRWETIKVLDPDDPEHKHLIEKKVHKERYQGEDQWRDMVEAEEQKEKAREEAAHEEHEKHKKHKPKSNGKNGKEGGETQKEEKQEESSGEKKKEPQKDEKKGQ